MFRRILRDDPLDFVVAALAVLASVFAWAGDDPIATPVLWTAAFAALVCATYLQRSRFRWPASITRVRAPLLVLAAAAASPVVRGDIADPVPAWASLGVLLLAISLASTVERVIGYVGVRAANIRGIRVLPALPSLKRALHLALFAATAAIFLFSRLSLHGWVWALAAEAVVIIVLAVYIIAALRQRVSHAARAALPAALEALAPEFVVYWDAPKSTQFQLEMWLPYLRRIGRPFFIMLRDSASWADARAVCGDAPIVFAPQMIDIDEFTVPSLRVAFYTNNAARNTHYIRFSELTHVQLLHGESDKAPSFNPVSAMYDKVFVAGRAGQDRYAAHGVYIDERKFEIVGRPQVESVRRATVPLADLEQPTVLYAPTWRGVHLDSSYCSLGVGDEIVEELLERGCAVIFRPHPWSYNDAEHRAANLRIIRRLEAHAAETGTKHLYGVTAEREMSVNDCFNASDAMIADVSSVVGDYLHSLKPLATTAIARDPAEFAIEFPLSRAGYVLAGSRADWAAPLDALLGADPAIEQRTEMRTYYLGDFPEDDYASGFVDAARGLFEPAPTLAVGDAPVAAGRP